MPHSSVNCLNPDLAEVNSTQYGTDCAVEALLHLES